MTQSEKIAIELRSIKPKLVNGDATACARETGTSTTNVIRYLNGEVRNVERGIDTLNFFKTLLEERDKKIKKLLL